ncbi:MAG: hypothetical protein ACRCV3_00760 [Desulfovibrionaceae bacterium]
MHIKTFTGTSITHLLSQVKSEFGSDAVVLSTREFKENDKVLHEMIVGIENSIQAMKLNLPVPSTENTQKEQASIALKEISDQRTILDTLDKLTKEWTSLKESVETVLHSRINMNLLSPRQKNDLALLQKEGLTEYIHMILYKELKKDSTFELIDVLANILPLRAWSEENWRNRLHCLIGPSGCGKSTSTLRMALNLRQKNPKLQMLLLNLDTEKGYGKLFLRYFSGLSNISYQEAKNKEEMEEILRTSSAERILIDTPTMGKNESIATYLHSMGIENPNIHIVLSSCLGQKQIEHSLQHYRFYEQGSIIWTKLDEAVSYGSLINTTITSALPISALSFGTELNKSLYSAEEGIVWKLIFKHSFPQQ